MRAPLTPLKAFVHDASKLGPAGSADPSEDARLSHWLAVAQAAERLVDLPPDHRHEYLQVLGESVLHKREGRPTQIEGDGRNPTDPLTLLAERLRLEAEDMERAGCFELALTTVSAVCQLVARGSLTSRLLATAHLGRVSRQMGDLTTATDCYSTVTELGEAANDGPVAAHGFIGLGNVAFVRGNRPDQSRFFRRALDLAAKGSPLELSAHQGLMIWAYKGGQLADALLHGWRAHDLAPPESDVQLEIVGNLANTAFEAGFFVAALSGQEFIVKQTTAPRLQLPAIGSAMRAAARTGDLEAVRRLEQLGLNCATRGAAAYEIGRFHWCRAEVHHIAGEHELVEPLIIESMRIADLHGFHELRYRCEVLLAADNKLSSVTESASSFKVDSNDPIITKGISRLAALSNA